MSNTRRPTLRAFLATLLLIFGAQGSLAGVCELLDFGDATGYGAILMGGGKSSIKGAQLKGEFNFAVSNGARLFDQGPAYSGGPVNTFENGRIDHHAGLEFKLQDDAADQ